MENWKDIEGYEGLYQVSNMGRVKSLERFRKGKHNSLVFVNEKILKSRKDGGGYLRVSLSKEGKIKTFKVHRLVASAFIDNPNNLLEVNHINEIKDDNRVNNLEWCNKSYNCNYGSRNERMAKSKYIPILQFTKEGKLVRKWDSITEVEKELGFNHGSISKCCKGKNKTCGGFKWCYHYKSIWEKNHIPLIKQKKVA